MKSEQLAWLIRRHGVEMTHISRGSHIGAILSVADIMAVLYADILKFDAKNPDWENRDRFILSKGHAGAALYAALAECGYFEVEELKTHYMNGSRLSGHVSHYVPGIDFSTGSLGHGLSVAAGRALAAKQDKKSFRSFVIIGDGECNEGSVWESAEFANHYKLDNLIAIVDYNHLQSLDFCNNTLEIEMARRWEGFGWHVIEIDGHDHNATCSGTTAFRTTAGSTTARSTSFTRQSPRELSIPTLLTDVPRMSLSPTAVCTPFRKPTIRHTTRGRLSQSERYRDPRAYQPRKRR